MDACNALPSSFRHVAALLRLLQISIIYFPSTMAVKTYNVTTVFEAPLNYVYRWCTDYREDDNLITGGLARRHFVEKTKNCVAWITHTSKEGREIENIRTVTLSPPNKWRVAGYGEELNEVGTYVLKPLGKKRTQLKMKFVISYKSAQPEPKASWESRVSGNWLKYRAALERDYSEGKGPLD